MCEKTRPLLQSGLRGKALGYGPPGGAMVYLQVFALWVLAAVPELAVAETAYRWVDADGNVTYSSQRPPDAQDLREVPIPPGPSEEQRRQAQERVQRTVEQLEATEKARVEARQARREATHEAEQALEEAERNLEEAKVLRPDDWILGYGTSGMRKPEYYERIKKAEQAVEDARSRLKKVRSGRL